VRIGLTYDLRDHYRALGFGEEETAEFDPPSTIDAIEGVLRGLAHETVRIGNVRELARRLAAGERFDLVFNTAEGIEGPGREAQVPALLDAFGVPYTFGDPLVCALTLHKGMTKRVMRDAGVPTPPFCVVEDERDLDDVRLPFPLFVKPVAEGTAKGIDGASRVGDPEALRARCREVLARYRQPALVEPFLPGREFTVGILGGGRGAAVLGTLEVALLAGAEPDSYTYLNKERCEDLCAYSLADRVAAAPAEQVALAAWRAVGGVDAGRVDVRLDTAGRPQVLEVNALPGLHPTHSDLPMIASAVGLAYAELIGSIVRSAASRARARFQERSAPARLPRLDTHPSAAAPSA